MSELTDISIGLNESGQKVHLSPISIQNGLLIAKATDEDPQIYPLWPGFYIGKVGDQYPIPSKYHCLYIALKTDVPSSYLQAFWFANEHLNDIPSGGRWGQTVFKSIRANQWGLYKLDLIKDALNTEETTKWEAQFTWKGIRIDPGTKKDALIYIDWIRLTDCKPTNLEFHLSHPYPLYFYIKPEYGTEEIYVGQLTPDYKVDLQGIAPGNYTFRLDDGKQTILQGSLRINQTPILEFTRPSPLSGPSLSWDMSDSSDVGRAECIEEITYEDGTLSFVTPSNICEADGAADPKIHLIVRRPIISNRYRYLNYRIYTEWTNPWANVPQGMIVRWIWSTQGISGSPGYRCHWVSQDLPFDVGWNIYSVDLFDPLLGTPEQWAGECPPNALSWKDSNTILELRFDPNENITGSPFFQKIDWIHLTGVEEVKQGNPFSIRYKVTNDQIGSPLVKFYYTSDPSTNPTMYLAQEVLASPPVPPSTHNVFLPLVLNNASFSEPIDETFFWDTSKASPGEYYLCANVTDGINETIYCSEAPIRIIAP